MTNSKLKAGIRLMFWSGADFGEVDLKINTGKFKDASITYTTVEQITWTMLHAGLKNRRKYSGIIKTSSKEKAFY